MLDTALRPRAFPPEAGSLLPGLLAATRTGPSPAGDDELVVESRCSTHRPPTVWAHSGSSWNFGGDPSGKGLRVGKVLAPPPLDLRSHGARAIVKCCGSWPDRNQAATLSSVVGSSSVTRMPSLNFTSASTSATSSWPLKRRQRSCAASSSL